MFRQKGVKKLTFDDMYDPEDIGDYLAHYGRKGMKWYQHIFGRLQSHAKYTKQRKSDTKTLNYKKASNEDLQKRIGRLKLEKEYLDLTKDTRTRGKAIADSVLQSIGKGLLRSVEDQTKNLGNKLIGQMISEFEKEKNKKG